VKNIDIIGSLQVPKTNILPQKNTIVVVDDDPSILEAMKMILEFNNYHVVTIGDGEILTKLALIQPKLLFLDICMSGVDGRDICKSLKAADATKDITVVMISASCDLEDVIKGTGADDYLAKPFELRDLLSKVTKYLLN
jgi:DNA-binding response OmpR family regulator